MPVCLKRKSGGIGVGQVTVAHTGRARLKWIALLATALAAAVINQPAAAQVIDIGADGVVTRLDGPAVIHSADLRGIEAFGPSRPRFSPSDRSPLQAAPVLATIAEAARANQLHPALLEAVAWQESRLHQGAVSPKGAVGVMQLMPATAASLAVDAHDPQANIHGGARQLRWLLARYNGDLVRTLAAYNAGTGAVDRYDGVPPYPETRAYVAAVLERLASRAIMARP